MSRIVLFNKPYGVLSQFTDEAGRDTLARYIPLPGVYAAGRLDADSEGLLVLTDDGRLQTAIAHPGAGKQKTYLVQVEGLATPNALTRLRKGVLLKDGPARPADVRAVDPPAALWERVPPIRFRRNDVTSWLEITLTEGRNRQVRRMTAAVGLPTLRLVRIRVGEWRLDGLAPGEYRVIQVPDLPTAARPVRKKTASSRPASAPRGTRQPPFAPPSGPAPTRRSRASRKARGS